MASADWSTGIGADRDLTADAGAGVAAQQQQQRQQLVEAIGKATTHREVLLAYRAAVRGAVDCAVADIARDEALRHVVAGGVEDTMMNSAQEVMPGVFLGPFAVARDDAQLRRLGVTHVLCLSAEGRCGLQGITYLEHALVETQCTLQEGGSQLAKLVPSSVAFVVAALESGSRVLIHCLHGRTLSAAIATCVRAYLLKEDFSAAYRAVQACRDVHIPTEWHATLSIAVLSCGALPSSAMQGVSSNACAQGSGADDGSSCDDGDEGWLDWAGVLPVAEAHPELLGLAAVLFLDVDGVLHPVDAGDCVQSAADLHNVLTATEALDSIIGRAAGGPTSVAVVLSSTWRHGFEHDAAAAGVAVSGGGGETTMTMMRVCARKGSARRLKCERLHALLQARLVSKTPRHATMDRSSEILAWVHRFQPQTWVAVDDESVNLSQLPDSHRHLTDCDRGLTADDAQCITAKLHMMRDPSLGRSSCLAAAKHFDFDPS